MLLKRIEKEFDNYGDHCKDFIIENREGTCIPHHPFFIIPLDTINKFLMDFQWDDFKYPSNHKIADVIKLMI